MYKEDQQFIQEILIKLQKAGTFELLKPFASHVIHLYTKRFGNIQYAKSISEEEFIKQLLDCVNHIVAVDVNAQKLFNSFANEDEQSAILALISIVMFE